MTRGKVNQTGRSKAAAKHVRLHEWLLASPAYRTLSSHGRSLLVEIYRLYRGDNNGDLFLSVRSAAKAMAMAPNTATKAFKELVEHGFVRARQTGAFSWKTHTATTWILTEHPFAGQPATKDFMRWSPLPKPKAKNKTRYQTVRRNVSNGATLRPKKGSDGIKPCDVKDENGAKNVAPFDTQLVNHGGWGEQKTSTAPKTRPRSIVSAIWPSRGANDQPFPDGPGLDAPLRRYISPHAGAPAPGMASPLVWLDLFANSETACLLWLAGGLPPSPEGKQRSRA